MITVLPPGLLPFDNEVCGSGVVATAAAVLAEIERKPWQRRAATVHLSNATRVKRAAAVSQSYNNPYV